MNPQARVGVASGHIAPCGMRPYVHRDARINEFHQGTSEIQRLVTALKESGSR